MVLYEAFYPIIAWKIFFKCSNFSLFVELSLHQHFNFILKWVHNFMAWLLWRGPFYCGPFWHCPFCCWSILERKFLARISWKQFFSFTLSFSNFSSFFFLQKKSKILCLFLPKFLSTRHKNTNSQTPLLFFC